MSVFESMQDREIKVEITDFRNRSGFFFLEWKLGGIWETFRSEYEYGQAYIT